VGRARLFKRKGGWHARGKLTDSTTNWATLVRTYSQQDNSRLAVSSMYGRLLCQSSKSCIV
jgi:hypothetical protein